VSQLKGRHWVTQPAVVRESSKGLPFGSLFMGSQDDLLWSVLSVLATSCGAEYRLLYCLNAKGFLLTVLKFDAQI